MQQLLLHRVRTTTTTPGTPGSYLWILMWAGPGWVARTQAGQGGGMRSGLNWVWKFNFEKSRAAGRGLCVWAVSMTDLGTEKDGRWENWLTASRPVLSLPVSSVTTSRTEEWFIITITSNITSLLLIVGIWGILQFIWLLMLENCCGCRWYGVLNTVWSIYCLFRIELLIWPYTYSDTAWQSCKTLLLSEYDFAPL